MFRSQFVLTVVDSTRCPTRQRRWRATRQCARRIGPCPALTSSGSWTSSDYWLNSTCLNAESYIIFVWERKTWRSELRTTLKSSRENVFTPRFPHLPSCWKLLFQRALPFCAVATDQFDNQCSKREKEKLTRDFYNIGVRANDCYTLREKSLHLNCVNNLARVVIGQSCNGR